MFGAVVGVGGGGWGLEGEQGAVRGGMGQAAGGVIVFPHWQSDHQTAAFRHVWPGLTCLTNHTTGTGIEITPYANEL